MVWATERMISRAVEASDIEGDRFVERSKYRSQSAKGKIEEEMLSANFPPEAMKPGSP
jgi:hypothetical protein